MGRGEGDGDTTDVDGCYRTGRSEKVEYRGGKMFVSSKLNWAGWARLWCLLQKRKEKKNSNQYLMGLSTYRFSISFKQYVTFQRILLPRLISTMSTFFFLLGRASVHRSSIEKLAQGKSYFVAANAWAARRSIDQNYNFVLPPPQPSLALSTFFRQPHLPCIVMSVLRGLPRAAQALPRLATPSSRVLIPSSSKIANASTLSTPRAAGLKVRVAQIFLSSLNCSTVVQLPLSSLICRRRAVSTPSR